MSEKSMQKRLNFLTAYAIISSAVFCAFAFMSFSSKERKEEFDEITVKRINLVDEQGSLRMVISNSERQHPGMMNGEDFPPRKRHAGMIFFNSQGDEVGGLIYDGNNQQAGMVLSIDQYKDDQLMQLQYKENTLFKQRKYGLQLWDFQKENSFQERTKVYEAMAEVENPAEKQALLEKMRQDSLLKDNRLFLGHTFEKEVGLFLNDQNGNPRIKIYIDRENNPKMEFLDERGEVVKTGI